MQEQCPWAVIVMDRFHGIKSATQAFHTVRKRVARHPAETDRRRLTGRRNLLDKAPEDWRPEKRLALYGVLADFPALRLAHSLVHWLRRWYDLPDVQMARARLRAWLYRIKKAPWEDVVGNITEGGTGMPGHTRLLGLWLTLLSCELSLYYKRLLKNPTLTPIFTIQDLT